MRFKCSYCDAVTSGEKCRNCGAARYDYGEPEPDLARQYNAAVRSQKRAGVVSPGMAGFAEMLDYCGPRVLTTPDDVAREMHRYKRTDE